MLISDEFIFLIVLLLALMFMILAFMPLGDDFSEELHTQGFSIGMIPAIIRIQIFPIASAISWGLLAIYAVSINNCSSAFGGTCWTSPLFLTVTGTGYANFADLGLAFFFTLMAIVMSFVALFVGITLFGELMIATGRREPKKLMQG